MLAWGRKKIPHQIPECAHNIFYARKVKYDFCLFKMIELGGLCLKIDADR